MPEDKAPSTAPAARQVRRAAAGALAAELGHDLQGAFNLFRSMTERLEQGKSLDAEDVALLREELTRLRDLSARLRELARTTLNRAEHTPREVLEAALSPPLSSTNLELEVPEGASFTLCCDKALLGLALRELIDNALEARKERAGVRFELGAEPGFCVWDDGATPAVNLTHAIRFGISTREGAAGLGLTLALRAARAHGFRLDLRRHGGLTEARLLIVARDALERDTKGTG